MNKSFRRPRADSYHVESSQSIPRIKKPIKTMKKCITPHRSPTPDKIMTTPQLSFSNVLRSKLSKNSASNSLKSSLLTSQTQVITVRILSNWGNSEKITCAEIIPLDEETHQIPILSSSVTPFEAGQTDIEKIMTGFKDKPNSIWTSKWPLRASIEARLILPGDNSVKMMRFMNASDNDESGIKNVEIWNEEKLIWSGEIPNDFGLVAHFDQKVSERDLASLTSILCGQCNKLTYSCDKYGLIPQYGSNSITFVFIDNYAHSLTYGLSGIEIFSVKKEWLGTPSFAKIQAKNCSIIASPATLFRRQYVDPKDEEMWKFDRVGKLNPYMSISFPNPTQIGQIRIWNYFPTGSVGEESNIGVKKMAIYLDNEPVFFGKLRLCDGTLKNIAKSITYISLGEMDHKFNKRQEKSD